MRVRSFTRPDPVVIDGALALGLFAFGQVELWTRGAVSGPHWFGFAIVTLGTLPIAFRRTHAVLALAAATATYDIVELAGETQSSASLAGATLCALYGASVWTGRWGFAAGLCLVGVFWLVSGLTYHDTTTSSSGGSHLRALGWLVVPLLSMLLVRSAVRGRELRAQALAARAEALEREADLRMREAAARERAMIARELHDVVAHNVSVMVVQAGAERSVLDPAAVSTAETLRAIEVSGREALVELRRLLGVLRGGADDPLEPQPTLADVDRLVEQIRQAGVGVTLAVEGQAARLPRGVELSAYRIVQEALTNILKHAPGADAEVRLSYEPDAIAIEVRDGGGTPTIPSGSGHGLLGMQERAALHGGSVAAGPEADGGFRVSARLPVLA